VKAELGSFAVDIPVNALNTAEICIAEANAWLELRLS
jgi:hypothetical protein